MSELTTTSQPNVDAADRSLLDAVLAFIAAPSDADFDGLALAIHRYQYRRNAPYRRFVDRSERPAPASWREIPAVPAGAFRDSVLACGPVERVYESSGTTQGLARRARHHVPDLVVYEHAALTGFHRAVLPRPERRRFIVAAPERPAYATSSLAEMVSWLRRDHDIDGSPSFLSGGILDTLGLACALDDLDPSQPIVLLAVTSALLRLMAADGTTPARWRLPARSIIVDTGGCKGHAVEVPRDEIVRRYCDAFAVSADQIVNEYGMTEMCSQLYARGRQPLVPPPWLRTLVCDPLTGEEVPRGRPGVLRHVDLANVGSVIAIQTEDVGRAVDGGIELLGRVARAESRGCSLLVSA